MHHKLRDAVYTKIPECHIIFNRTVTIIGYFIIIIFLVFYVSLALALVFCLSIMICFSLQN